MSNDDDSDNDMSFSPPRSPPLMESKRTGGFGESTSPAASQRSSQQQQYRSSLLQKLSAPASARSTGSMSVSSRMQQEFKEAKETTSLPPIAGAGAGAAGSSKIVALLNLSDHTVHVKSSVPMGEPLFLATPGNVTFRDYTPFQTYVVTISLRNKDTVRARPAAHPRCAMLMCCALSYLGCAPRQA